MGDGETKTFITVFGYELISESTHTHTQIHTHTHTNTHNQWPSSTSLLPPDHYLISCLNVNHLPHLLAEHTVQSLKHTQTLKSFQLSSPVAY